MSRATDDQLVLLLRHPNGWLRDTAARLLYERQNRSAVVPLIRLAFDTAAPPIARMHALHALDGLHVTADGRAGNALLEAHIIKTLSDLDERVRQHAVLLTERFIAPGGAISDNLWAQLSALANDGSPLVRYQLAFTLGDIRHAGRGQILAQILRADSVSPWTQAAVASSLDEGAAEMLDFLIGDAEFRNRPGSGEFFRHLFEIIGAKNQPADVALAVNDLQKIADGSLAFTIARAFDNGLQRGGSSLAAADRRGVLPSLYENAGRTILDPNADENARVAALRLASLARSLQPGLTQSLLLEWPRLNARLRRESINFLLSRFDTTDMLLQSMQLDLVSKTELTSAQIRYLFSLRGPLIPGQVTALYGPGPDNSPRQAIINRFAPALSMTGRAQAGREIFANRCAACHQVNGIGNRVGTDLGEAAKTGKPRLLAKILDPNCALPPTNPNTYVETAAGENLYGFLTAENPKWISLCDAAGVEHVIAHANLVARVPLNFSPMPNGLENGLNPQDMADLLEFVGSSP